MPLGFLYLIHSHGTVNSTLYDQLLFMICTYIICIYGYLYSCRFTTGIARSCNSRFHKLYLNSYFLFNYSTHLLSLHPFGGAYLVVPLLPVIKSEAQSQLTFEIYSILCSYMYVHTYTGTVEGVGAY